jgi:hypothetical protein
LKKVLKNFLVSIFIVIFTYQLINMARTSNPRPNVNPLALPKLALAGRAVLTFRNLETGSHMTVKIKQLRDREDRKKKLPIFYVTISLLNDGVQSTRFAGTLFEQDLRIKLGRDVTADSRLGRAFNWVVNAIRNPQSLVGRVGLFHEGKCCACGLPLTHPESIHTALGPVCFERMLSSMQGGEDISALFTPVS